MTLSFYEKTKNFSSNNHACGLLLSKEEKASHPNPIFAIGKNILVRLENPKRVRQLEICFEEIKGTNNFSILYKKFDRGLNFKAKLFPNIPLKFAIILKRKTPVRGQVRILIKIDDILIHQAQIQQVNICWPSENAQKRIGYNKCFNAHYKVTNSNEYILDFEKILDKEVILHVAKPLSYGNERDDLNGEISEPILTESKTFEQAEEIVPQPKSQGYQRDQVNNSLQWNIPTQLLYPALNTQINSERILTSHERRFGEPTVDVPQFSPYSLKIDDPNDEILMIYKKKHASILKQHSKNKLTDEQAKDHLATAEKNIDERRRQLHLKNTYSNI